MQATEWPPLYSIKRHWRAKHVKLSYSATHGLEVTIPKRFSLKHLPAIIEEHKDWIIKQKLTHISRPAPTRPLEIDFLAIKQKWTVHYFQNQKQPRIKEFSNDGIILSGDIEDINICRAKLDAWVRKQARLHLIPYFHNLAVQLSLPYSDVTIRAQSTLWGSCSQDKSIRLNYKLLFLPEELMRHIMIHELCHTKHMNHSEKFWQLVSIHDDNWEMHKKAMRAANKFMPAWI
jgi:predicted metal-dependent hydrolase